MDPEGVSTVLFPLSVRYHPDSAEGSKEAIFECLTFLPAIIC